MITIISVFDKHIDFIKMQYDSIKKNISGNFEYVLFNNGSSLEQKN